MKQQTKSKALIILNIILLLALFTIPVYAYWASKVNAPDDETDGTEIIIGEAGEVNTVIEFDKLEESYGVLVPASRRVGDQVEEIVLTFDVLWTDEDAASHGANGELTITPSFSEGTPSLLKVVVNGNDDKAITAGEHKPITLTITLDEPANLEEYNSVKNKTFTLSITFNVVPK